MRSLRWIAVLAAALVPAYGQAASFSLNDLTLADFDKIVKEFSGNFAYTSVTPASSLGGLWGFELGAIGGFTKAPELQSLVRRSDPGFKEDKLPHGGGLLRIGAPLGLTAEAVVFPKMKISDLNIGQYSGAAMWTITDVFFSDWPVTMAVKGFFTKVNMDYSQRLSNSTTGGVPIDAKIGYENSLYGGQFLVSRKIFLFEPYLGIGYAKSVGEISVSASNPNASLFPGLPSNLRNNVSSKPSSVQLLAGLDFRILFLSLGAEYQRSFGTSSATGRLSFRF